MKLAHALAIAATLLTAGCEMPEPAPSFDAGLPACDTLRVVYFISRCDQATARCGLLSTAPAGSMASGCQLTVVAQPGGPEQVECVETCP